MTPNLLPRQLPAAAKLVSRREFNYQGLVLEELIVEFPYRGRGKKTRVLGWCRKPYESNTVGGGENFLITNKYETVDLIYDEMHTLPKVREQVRQAFDARMSGVIRPQLKLVL